MVSPRPRPAGEPQVHRRPARHRQTRGEAFAKEITDFLKAQSAIVTPMWDSPIEALAQDRLTNAIEKIYAETATPEEALADAQGASRAELDGCRRADGRQ